jgi:alpha-ketoglutarate-dependent taurine dioxygenase
MPRPFDIEPLNATFGAVIRGIQVTDLDDVTWRELYAAWLQYALLIFPDQHLARDHQIAFARRNGGHQQRQIRRHLRREGDNDDMM